MTARRFPSIIYATEQGARNACARIDEHLGRPVPEGAAEMRDLEEET
jgi:hypothetical protein